VLLSNATNKLFMKTKGEFMMCTYVPLCKNYIALCKNLTQYGLRMNTQKMTKYYNCFWFIIHDHITNDFLFLHNPCMWYAIIKIIEYGMSLWGLKLEETSWTSPCAFHLYKVDMFC